MARARWLPCALSVLGWLGTAGPAPAQQCAWSPLGGGTNDFVNALAVFDDGRGPALYAGGDFRTAGGAPASHVARWDGAGWSPLGGGLSGFPGDRFALAVFDDGGGPALYAGGLFTTAGDVPASNIAAWQCVAP